MRCACSPSKCEGHVSASYLEINQCEIIGRKTSPRLFEKKMKNDKNFMPHLITVEKSRKRKDRGTRSEAMHRSVEDTLCQRNHEWFPTYVIHLRTKNRATDQKNN